MIWLAISARSEATTGSRCNPFLSVRGFVVVREHWSILLPLWLAVSARSEKSKIRGLGRIAVRAMDNAPFELQLSTWTRRVMAKNGHHAYRVLTVSWLLLVSWVGKTLLEGKEFNFHSLPTLGDVGDRSSEDSRSPWEHSGSARCPYWRCPQTSGLCMPLMLWLEREICLLAVERCRGWPASNLRPSPPMTTSYHSSSTSAIPS